MNSKSGLLTLNGIRQKKASTKRLLADGRYLISGEPRSGGIASVFRAFDTQAEKFIALKIFRAIVGTDAVVEESFRRETQALFDLKHSGIVQIFDSGFDVDTGEHYIAMEWVEEDLASVLSREKFQSWDSFFSQVGRQILEALAFAHSHRIVHRDIKPSNVLVTAEGVAKLCDFGISKIRNFLEPGVTLAHFASFPYAPPEIDDGSYSYSRDVFGFVALAVDAVRFGRAVNPTLGDYIVDPTSVPIPAVGEISFIQSEMDEDKRDAVLTALAEPALMLVQGPPGAGKTTFITEVVLQTLRRNPNARILLTSQTHVALDNSLERILKESKDEVRAIRIGNEADDRIAEKTKALLIDRKLPAMRKTALAKGREFIESWAQKSGVDLTKPHSPTKRLSASRRQS